MFKKYMPFLKANIMQMFVYRASVVMWFLVDLVYYFMAIFLWRSIYSSSGKSTIKGFTIDEMIIYFLIIGMIVILTQVEAMWTVSQEIRQGRISMYLIKPINYKTRIFFEETGRRIGISMIMIPISLIIITIAYFWLDLNLSFNITQIIIFFLFIPFGFLLMFEYTYFFGLLSIYTTNAFGLSILSNIIVVLLSGQLIPIDFFPDIMQKFMRILPFQFINYYPTMVLMGKIEIIQVLNGFLLLIVWILFFKFINYILFKFNEKKIVIFGG